MNCEYEFNNNTEKGLNIFMDFFEKKTNRNIELIRPLIRNKIKFEIKYHSGPIKPEYYFNGIPQVWKCIRCGATITN